MPNAKNYQRLPDELTPPPDNSHYLPEDWAEAWAEGEQWQIPPGMTATEWYKKTFKTPIAPEGSYAFAGNRESRNVIDKRNEPMGLREQLHAYEMDRYGQNTSPYDYTAANNRPMLDNRHTQAVDGLVARLEGYQNLFPSRGRFFGPNTINNEVADDMRKYYGEQRMGEDAYARVMRKLNSGYR